jgi:hypothetical protein
MTDNKVCVGVRLSPELKARVVAVALKNQRSLTQVCELLILEALEYSKLGKAETPELDIGFEEESVA